MKFSKNDIFRDVNNRQLYYVTFNSSQLPDKMGDFCLRNLKTKERTSFMTIDTFKTRFVKIDAQYFANLLYLGENDVN